MLPGSEMSGGRRVPGSPAAPVPGARRGGGAGQEEHWSLTSVMPGPARLSAGTSQRFRANLRVAAGPDLAESAPGPEGRWRPMGVGGAASPLRLRRRRGAPAGSRAAAFPQRACRRRRCRRRQSRLWHHAWRPARARSGFQEAGGGAFQPRLAVAAAPRARRAGPGPSRSLRADAPTAGGGRGRAAPGRAVHLPGGAGGGARPPPWAGASAAPRARRGGRGGAARPGPI